MNPPQYFRTKVIAGVDHPAISIMVTHATGVDVIIDFFEQHIEKGRRFNAGETVQIGWMIVMIKDGSHGELELWEPRFDSFPIIWTKGLDNTLRHIILQKSVCESCNCDPDFPSFRQAGIISNDFLDYRRNFSMTRESASDNDSGWLFISSDQNVRDDDGEFRSLFEIGVHRPDVIAFLALPAGAKIQKTERRIDIEINNQVISSAGNIFLRQLVE